MVGSTTLNSHSVGFSGTTEIVHMVAQRCYIVEHLLVCNAMVLAMKEFVNMCLYGNGFVDFY